MGAARKLQQEIDQVMKKVKEGIASFDEIHEKIEDQSQGHQRDKLVASLKDQIKKLQKDRDKIKTWLGDKDVRDKNGLTDARATIERRMEKFKECEKDMKVKNFSKIGLDRGTKQDPRQAAIMECIEWLKQTIDALNTKVEVNEAEIEVKLGTVKRGKEPPQVARHLQQVNVRHKRHIERLEQVHRALSNEQIDFNLVDDIKETLECYLEDGDEDADGLYDDVDALYGDELIQVIDNVDVHVPILPDKGPLKLEADKNDKKAARLEREAEKARAEAERAKEREKANIAAMRAQIITGRGSATFPTMVGLEEKVVRIPREAHEPVAQPPPPPPRSQVAASSTAASPSPASQLTGGAAASHVSDSSASSTPVPKVLAPLPGGKAWTGAQPPPPPPPPGERSPEPPSLRSPSRASPASSIGTVAAPVSAPPPGLVRAPSNRLPSLGVEPLALSPELQAVPIVAPAPHEATHPAVLLEGKQLPPTDSIWNRNTCAQRTPATRLPESFPQAPPAFLDSASFYSAIPVGEEEQLFGIFYLLPGTLYQCQAAMELKRRSWQFHKQHRQWFRRHEQDWVKFVQHPSYEEGDYIYFDYQLDREDAWVFRLKRGYRLPYDMLEQSLLPQ